MLFSKLLFSLQFEFCQFLFHFFVPSVCMWVLPFLSQVFVFWSPLFGRLQRIQKFLERNQNQIKTSTTLFLNDTFLKWFKTTCNNSPIVIIVNTFEQIKTSIINQAYSEDCFSSYEIHRMEKPVRNLEESQSSQTPSSIWKL